MVEVVIHCRLLLVCVCMCVCVCACIAIVEHDVTEDDEVVKEEPQQPEFSPANSDYLEDDSPPQVANSDGEGAVSTVSNFFSGFAAAVQTTVRNCVDL